MSAFHSPGAKFHPVFQNSAAPASASSSPASTAAMMSSTPPFCSRMCAGLKAP